MKNPKSTWRLVMEIVGAALAVAGLVCLLIAYWDKLTEGFALLMDKCKCKHCLEDDDFADELMYE